MIFKSTVPVGKISFRVIRILLGLSLALWLVFTTTRKIEGYFFYEILKGKIYILVFTFLFHGMIVSLSGYRLKLLLQVRGIFLPIIDIIRLTMIGIFFNLTLLGTVSGDVVKMSLLAKHHKGDGKGIILSIVLDRVLGLFGLFIVAGVALLFFLPILMGSNEYSRSLRAIAVFVGTFNLAGFFFILSIEFRRAFLKISIIDTFTKYWAEKLPLFLVTMIQRIVNAFELYRKNKMTVLIAILLSILVHSCLAINLLCIGASVREKTIGFGEYFLVTQVSNIVAAIPLTPGGIGTRDATISLFLSSMHVTVQKGAVIPTVLTLIILFWGLVGGILFLFLKIHRSPNEEINLGK